MTRCPRGRDASFPTDDETARLSRGEPFHEIELGAYRFWFHYQCCRYLKTFLLIASNCRVPKHANTIVEASGTAVYVSGTSIL